MILPLHRWLLTIIVVCVTFTGFTQSGTPVWPESFENANKSTYSFDTIKLSSGSWTVNDALIGHSALDRKNGNKAIRIQHKGFIIMNYDIMDSPNELSLFQGSYGNDAPAVWALYSSIDTGKTWIKYKNNIHTSGKVLSKYIIRISHKKPIRFQIRMISGGRLNIDDISISNCNHVKNNSVVIARAPSKVNLPKSGGSCTCSNDTTPTRDDNMAMGNPSNATTSTTDSNNYLMIKPQYTLSYNNSKGTANWVSWHLSLAWKGSAARCNCFTQDTSLPSGYYKVTTSQYSGTGFNRGHLCPSEDRDSLETDNKATFLMTNMTPQSSVLNQQTWGSFETYCRTLITQGNELYIIAGGYGTGGTSDSGYATSLNSGKINVFAHYWKVVVVLPTGSNDVSRVTNTTRVIAVDMPNTLTVNAHTWDYYRVSVSSLESITGFNFLSNVSSSVQSVIEASADTGPTN